jgi:hypothetical protein
VTLADGAPGGCTTLGDNVAAADTASVALDGVTVTLVIAGGATETVIDTSCTRLLAAKPPPAALLAVTVMEALPADTAVTRPEALTVATAGALELYVTTAVGAPTGCCTDALTCVVAFTKTLADVGEIVSDVMPSGAAVTVTTTVRMMLLALNPAVPDDDAVTEMLVVPIASAVTTPDADTVATEGLALCHVMAAAGAPFGCVRSVVSCRVAPCDTDTLLGVTRKLLMPAGFGVIVTATNCVCDAAANAPAAGAVAVTEMLVAPGAIAVTSPAAVTEATDGLRD